MTRQLLPHDVTQMWPDSYVCNGCGASKPISEYYVRFDKKYEKWRRRKKCKVCEIKVNEDYNEKHKERLKEIRQGRYWADPEAARKRSRENERRRRERDPEGIRVEKRRWDSENREKVREMDRRSRAKHGDRWNAKNRWRYANDPGYRERKRQHDDGYRKANQKKIQARQLIWARANREKSKKYRETWERRNQEKLIEYRREKVRRRRARKLGVETDITMPFLNELRELHNGCCYYCGEPCDSLELEHMVALSKGGTHTKDNVVFSCPTCNYRKHTKSVAEFIVDNFGLSYG